MRTGPATSEHPVVTIDPPQRTAAFTRPGSSFPLSPTRQIAYRPVPRLLRDDESFNRSPVDLTTESGDSNVSETIDWSVYFWLNKQDQITMLKTVFISSREAKKSRTILNILKQRPQLLSIMASQENHEARLKHTTTALKLLNVLGWTWTVTSYEAGSRFGSMFGYVLNHFFGHDWFVYELAGSQSVFFVFWLFWRGRHVFNHWTDQCTDAFRIGPPV